MKWIRKGKTAVSFGNALFCSGRCIKVLTKSIVWLAGVVAIFLSLKIPIFENRFVVVVDLQMMVELSNPKMLDLVLVLVIL